MMDRRLGVIIRKELKRVFTDRRLIITVLLLPGLSIAVIYSIMGMAIGNMEEDRSVHEFVVEMYHAPDSIVQFIDEMPSQRIEIHQVDNIGNLEASKERLKEETIDLVLVFDADFDVLVGDYQDNGLPNINTFFNPVNDYSQDARNFMINQVFNSYRISVLGERLGGAVYTEVFSIDQDNYESSVASESKIAGKVVSGIIPIFISIFLFAGAMGIGIDMVAGEKERGTMATILLTPVKREAVVFGKIVSLGIVAVTATISSMAGIMVSFPILAKNFDMGIEFNQMTFTSVQTILLLITLILLVGIYVSIIILISVVSKTVKEAGSYITPVYMLVLISGILAILGGSDKTLLSHMIPVYGNVMILQSVISGEVDLTFFAVNACTSLVAIGVLVLLTKKMFYNENLMFS